MSRAQRLLDLVQALRRYRRPVSGQTLAAEMGVSIRTLYRDIGTLQTQGALIEGEAGVGYILRPGFMLPPLMFSEDEIEALVLGSSWVAERGDVRLAGAARDALAKIAAVLPGDLQQSLDATNLLVGPDSAAVDAVDIGAIRRAIRTERKIGIQYRDAGNRTSERIIWPFAIGFFDRARVVVAWCEARQDFRHFRTDRITALAPTDTRYPRRRQVLLADWRKAEGIAPPP
jgi:predicted DNA-binding transcriptional regulator YafY